MPSSSTPTRQTLPDLLGQDLNLLVGESVDFVLDGRVVALHGVDSGVAVISSGNAVVIRPQADDRFIVTGASAHHHPSEPLGREDAIRVALARLER